jgi:hypothetical protein
MQLQPTGARAALSPPLGWVGAALVGLLVLLALLLSELSLAHAKTPGVNDVSQPSTVSLEVTSTRSVLSAGQRNGPTCQHGQGKQALPVGLPPVERQGQDFERDDALLPTIEPATAPLLVPLSWTPRHRPAKSGLPVYLLTQRLRL